MLTSLRHLRVPGRVALGLLAACLLPCLLLPGAGTNAATEHAVHFPAVRATSLNKTQMRLPGDFGGQVNLVIISFAREQQHDVDSWLPAARKLEEAHGKFRYYELAAMGDRNILYRWYFNAALRTYTTDSTLRSRTLIVYQSKRQFRDALAIPNDKKAVAVLVDKTGRVLWRADGGYSDADMKTLQAAVAASGV